MKESPIVTEGLYDAPIEKVWKAFTDKNQMKQWYFDMKEFKPELGFEFQFSGGTEAKTYLHLCKITEVVPQKKLTHSWRYDGYSGDSLVAIEFSTEKNQTKVKLTHSGIETFPSGNADFAIKNFEQGWKEILGSNLKKFLAEH